MVYEKAYAKVNLFLQVTGKTSDGFHSLKTLMVPVDLYDELIFEQNNFKDNILIDNKIPNNSILIAAQKLQDKYGIPGTIIKCNKKIPMEAGLGGGSSDSSATLRGINKLFNLGCSLDELKKLADSLGSDNSFCLYNKAAICLGRGEQLSFIDKPFELNILLIKPSFGLSTREVFSNYSKCNRKYPTDDEIVNALYNEDYDKLNSILYNDLFAAAIKVEPKLDDLKRSIESFGVKVHMTGSGSTLFVIDEDVKRLNRIKNNYPELQCHLTKIKNTLS